MIWTSLIDSAFCMRLILSLGHFIWQATVIALLAGLAALLLRGASAQLRYIVLVVALGLMLVSPLVTFMLLPHSVGPVPPESSANPMTVSPVERTVGPASIGPTGVEPSESISAGKTSLQSEQVISQPQSPSGIDWKAGEEFAPYLAVCYGVGVAVMLLRLILGLGGGRRLRKIAELPSDTNLLVRMAKKAEAIGLRFTPVVAYCREVAVPMVVGILHPTILLPFSLATGLSTEQIDAILIHEF